MRIPTVLALVALVVVLGGVGAVAVVDSGSTLNERWVSDTPSDIEGNHHAVAAARIDGHGYVFAPIGGRSGETGCMLAALDDKGAVLWDDPVPPADCTIHAVADPAVATWPGEEPAVLSSTTEDRVYAHDPASGTLTFSFALRDYGYTKPVVADATGDGDPELVVLDVTGSVFVVRAEGDGREGPANGTTVWDRRFGAYTWAQPVVADLDADGDPEVVAGFDDRRVRLLDGATGRTEWNASAGGAVTWMTAGDADGDPTTEVFVATSNGHVVAFDGATGTVEWNRTFDRLAAVRALGDGDADGQPELYAVARDGVLRALDASTGETEWTTTLTTGDVQMTPPPSLGDVDGDGDDEVVAVTNDGIVRVLDPVDGAVLATYERDSTVYTHVTLADLDGDGADEIHVPYGDGRVVSLGLG